MTALSQPLNRNNKHSQGRGGFRVTGRMVLLTLIGFFGVVFLVNFYMAYMAIHTFAGLETENAYKLGLKYDREIIEAQAQQQRAWKVSAHISALGGAEHKLTVKVEDKAGQAVSDIRVEARILHPTQRERDVTVALKPVGSGVYEGMFAAPPGSREIETKITRGGERLFFSRNRVTIQ